MIPIAEDILRQFVPWERVPKLLYSPRGRGMLCHSHMHNASTIVGEEHQDEQQPARRRRATKKSAATSCCAWFAKKVRHVCEGGPCRRTMYFATVVEIVKPSLNNSP